MHLTFVGVAGQFINIKKMVSVVFFLYENIIIILFVFIFVCLQPRIVPLQLLKCLRVLLDTNGGILSAAEVKRIAG